MIGLGEATDSDYSALAFCQSPVARPDPSDRSLVAMRSISLKSQKFSPPFGTLCVPVIATDLWWRISTSTVSVRPILTDLRRMILEVVRTYHFLTTEQCYDVVFRGARRPSDERGLRRALQLMTEAGLLKRSRIVLDRPNDSFLRTSYCYRLASRGREALGVEPGDAPAGSWSLVHDTRVTAFHIALQRSIDPRTHRLYWLQRDLARTVKPDALFALTDLREPRTQSTFYYFLEVERSRQGHYRAGASGLVTKLKTYAEYRRSPQVRADWKHFTDFRVVVVLPTKERAKNVVEKLRHTLPQPIFWITSEDAYREGLAGAVFAVPTSTDARRIITVGGTEA